tara:strand:- start:781 stop:999 length:219 start_codon:yes stop_codon:yes gene_type:complete
MVGLITLLFAISSDNLQYAELSCKDANALIDRVYNYELQSNYITQKDVDEIVEIIKEATPECFNEGSERHWH